MTKEAAQNLAETMALCGAGFVNPNPLVGAVLVDKKHCFLAAGAHRQVGKAHAEQEVFSKIEQAGLAFRLDGARLYCTLEPCTFHGRTPACVEMILRYPLSEVVIAKIDPHPRVSGKGVELLKSSGIRVHRDLLWSKRCEYLTRVSSWLLTKQKPFIAVKMAVSIDGVYAKNGETIQITQKRSQKYAHFLRQFYDGIVVGHHTICTDNPLLTVREAFSRVSHPTRFIFDPRGCLFFDQPNWRVLSALSSGTIVCCASKYREQIMRISGCQRFCELGGNLMWLGFEHSFFDLEDFHHQVYQRGIYSLLIEGGGGVWSSYFKVNMWQYLYYFQAPTFLSSEETKKIYWGNKETISTHTKLSSIKFLEGDQLLEFSNLTGERID